jgi:HD-like signal output (HDOD) protein
MATLTADIASPLDELLQSGVTLPPLPEVGVRLLRMARQPIDQIDVHRLAGLIDSDPALALRILKLANSPYYSPQNEVTSLGQALMLIGPQEAIQTLCYFVLSNSMPRLEAMDHFNPDDFWAHSWACATAARMLCNPANGLHAVPGDLYLAGLLHGVGKLVLAQALPREFDRCLFTAKKSDTPLHQVEKQVLGYTESELAGKLLLAWELPETIRVLIGGYLDPELAPEPLRERAAVLQFGWMVANLSGIGSAGTVGESDLEQSWLVLNGKSALARPTIRESVVDEIMASFRQRALAVVGSGVKLETAEENPAPRKGPSAAPRQKTGTGFLARLKRFFTALFK